MDDPTMAEVAAALTFLEEELKGGKPEEAELYEFRKAIQNARMKNASTPWALTMTVNMNGTASVPGSTDDRRMLLTLIVHNVFPSLIFCQELPGCFEDKVVEKWRTGGSYKYVKTENEASVLWLVEEFDDEPVKTSFVKIVEELKRKRSDVEVSDVGSRIALVKLRKKGEEASSCQPFLAASWHGPYKGKDKEKVFRGLICFLREVCKKEKVSSFIVGGDFNIDTVNGINHLEYDGTIVPTYVLTSRAERMVKKGKGYISYKDNFILSNERYGDGIWVSSVRPLEFENSTDCGSDITKEDHQKFDKDKRSLDTEREDLLDHDPIVGILTFRPCKQTESPSSDEPAVDHNLSDSGTDGPDENDKDNDPITKYFARLAVK